MIFSIPSSSHVLDLAHSPALNLQKSLQHIFIAPELELPIYGAVLRNCSFTVFYNLYDFPFKPHPQLPLDSGGKK